MGVNPFLFHPKFPLFFLFFELVSLVKTQADLGDKKEIKKIARKHETRIVKEIPYSKEIVDAYSQGRLNKL